MRSVLLACLIFSVLATASLAVEFDHANQPATHGRRHGSHHIKATKGVKKKVSPRIIPKEHFVPRHRILTVPKGESAKHHSLLENAASVTDKCVAAKGVCKKTAECKDGDTVASLCKGVGMSCCFPPPPAPTPPPRCPSFGKTGTYTGTSAKLNKKAETKWELIPSVAYTAEKDNPYRVVRDAFGNMPLTDTRLVPIRSPDPRNPQKLHILCAMRFNALAAAAQAAGMGVLKVASGFREHPYKNDYKYYCQQMKIAYPKMTCQQAGEVKAFKSPHETGLAFDLGAPSPFSPDMKRAPAQRASKLFKWLQANAHKYGVTPYKHEPWHWECTSTRESWVEGCEWTSTFDTRIKEQTTKDKKPRLTTDINAWG